MLIFMDETPIIEEQILLCEAYTEKNADQKNMNDY